MQFNDDLSQEILDYLNAPSLFIEMHNEHERKKSQLAKEGKMFCTRTQCSNYYQTDNDGYGWRECGCCLDDIDHEVCPYRRIKSYKYTPQPLVKFIESD